MLAARDGVPLQVNPIVDIPVRKIMSRRAAQHARRSPTQTRASAARWTSRRISVQFLYFAPGQLATPAQSKDVVVEVDTIGPAPPTGLRTEPGNGRIKVLWDNISGEGGVSVLTGVKVYCDLVGSTTTPTLGRRSPRRRAPRSRTHPTRTTTAARTRGQPRSAKTPARREPARPRRAARARTSGTDVIPDTEFNKLYECGSISGNSGSSVVATSLRGQPLQNRTADNPSVTYAVAVAATDAFNNVGALDGNLRVPGADDGLLGEVPERRRTVGRRLRDVRRARRQRGRALRRGNRRAVRAAPSFAKRLEPGTEERSMKRGICLAVAAGALLVSADAAALELGTPASEHPSRSPQNFALELRFSPYYPNVDQEPGLQGQPFKESFGDKARLYVGLEFDWQTFRIPYVGTIGPGLGVGTVSMSRPATTATNRKSGDDYGLTIYPIYLAAVLRVDAFWRGAGFPVVPYGKLGGAVGFWDATNSGGTARSTDGIKGSGATLGTHAALGVAVPLDFLDTGASRNMDNAVGINNTYLYAEYYWLGLNGLGQDKALYVGTNTWAAGLAFEF